MTSFSAYGWSTQKTNSGYFWRVVGINHEQPMVTLVSGVCPTRAKAVSQAKKNIIIFRKSVK
jgi:hypothetical protein